jgi:hypothetical protein
MFSRDQLKRAATLTGEDCVELGRCRRPHNRLGFAYQVAFVRLFDRTFFAFSIDNELYFFLRSFEKVLTRGVLLQLLMRTADPVTESYANSVKLFANDVFKL